MESSSLTCLGVGDGMACVDRNHSSHLYRWPGTALLVDCGEPVSRSLREAGVAASLVDAILLSHLHSDHLAGFFMLIQGFWLAGRRKELRVHLPADGIEPVRAMLRAAYLFEELLRFRIVWEPITAGVPIGLGRVQVTPFATSHLDRLRQAFRAKYPGGYEAYSFLIESPGHRIGHSADLGRVEDLEPLLDRPLDLLVCELAHFPPRKLFAFLQGRQVKRVIFTHLGRRYWEDLTGTTRLAAQMLRGMKVSFARDGERFRLANRRA